MLIDGKAKKLSDRWKKWADRYRLDMIDLQEQELQRNSYGMKVIISGKPNLALPSYLADGKTDGQPF